MEPLYETTEEITLEEYVRFAKTIYWKDKHGADIFLAGLKGVKVG